jgi:hypothetical protein
VCVVPIDRAMLREDNQVRKPNKYFRSILRKPESGELHRHKWRGDKAMSERRTKAVSIGSWRDKNLIA